MELQTRAVQSTTFSPRLQHAVRLLQMSSMDYAQALHDAAQENPFLDVEEAEPQEDWTTASALDRLAGAGSHEPGARGLPHEDSADALQGVALERSLRAHLHEQLGVLRLDAAERAAAQAVVESLDDDGYLRISLDEIGAAVGLAGAADEEVLRTALRRVQSLDPAGVAARDVAECLRLQLGAIAEAQGLRALAARIVDEHLDLLASRNVQRLAAVLGAPADAVRRACDQLRHLNARPGWQFGGGDSRAIPPDVIVRKVRGQWMTVLNDAIVPRVQLNSAYARLFEKHRSREHTELTGCLEHARWTVQNVAQRISTIRDVAAAIVARQKLFLEYGPLAMKPLGLKEIADAVGVHPSTVSRTVHNKYMATPLGVFELKYFFSRGVEHGAGGASAPSAVRALIGDLIAAEKRSAPLSDAELARQLAQQGFRIARRTVTKYRQALRILPVEQRRQA